MLAANRLLYFCMSVLLIACPSSRMDQQPSVSIEMQVAAISDGIQEDDDDEELDLETEDHWAEDLEAERKMNEDADDADDSADEAALVDGGPALSAAPMELAIADGIFQTLDKRSRDTAYVMAKDLGVTWLRSNVIWEGKGDPLRIPIDKMISEAQDNGLHVQLTLTGDGKTVQIKNASDFGKFVRDAVEKFCAMGVHRYSIWNEPNSDIIISKSRHTVHPADIYRSLYLRAYNGARLGAKDAAAKTGTKCNPRQLRVLLGELHPGGITKKMKGGGTSVQRERDPIPFLQRMITGQKLRASGLALHPYQYTISPKLVDKDHPGGIGSLAEIQKFLSEAHVAGTLMTAKRQVVPLYLTEFGYKKNKCNQCSCPFAPGSACGVYVCPKKNCINETLRAQWSYEANVQALKFGTRQMVYYHLTPDSSCRGGEWDSSLTDSLFRPRESYCSLKKWAFDKGYIASSDCTPTAADPPCPGKGETLASCGAINRGK